jgi:hypothetical protein
MLTNTSVNASVSEVRRKPSPANLLARIVKAEPVITVDGMAADGDVTFSVPVRELGISRSAWARIGLFRTAFFVNFVGDWLVRQNLAQFAGMLAQIDARNYDQIVNGFSHRHFGMLVDEKDVVHFRFHISLIQRILAEDIEGALTE